ncbi:MAG: hypothetical protein ABIJ48_13055 [Actinomycetota bacterium]
MAKAAIALMVGLALVFALVFARPVDAEVVAQPAGARHAAAEALRTATVARAQAGMAALLC